MAGNERGPPWGLIIVVSVLAGGGLLAYWIYSKVKQGAGILGTLTGSAAGGAAGALVGVSTAIANAAGGAGAVIVSPITNLQSVASTVAANAETNSGAIKNVVASSGAQNAAVTTAENNSITNGSSQYAILMVEVNAYDPIVAPFVTPTAYSLIIADGVPASKVNVYLNAIENDAASDKPTTIVGGKVSASAVQALLTSYGVPSSQAASVGTRLAGK